jgi:hypothetical protein
LGERGIGGWEDLTEISGREGFGGLELGFCGGAGFLHRRHLLLQDSSDSPLLGERGEGNKDALCSSHRYEGLSHCIRRPDFLSIEVKEKEVNI